MLGSCSKIPVGIYSKETGRVSGTMLHNVEAKPTVPNCKVPCEVAPHRLELRCMVSALNLKPWRDTSFLQVISMRVQLWLFLKIFFV